MGAEYAFLIKRHVPGRVERRDIFTLRMEPSERVLDGLLKIKDEHDGSLAFRRSCGHGICGSCAMMINGRNALACQSLMKDMPREVSLEPLPALPVIKDLVVDMEPFFRLNEEVMPYLLNPEPPPERERLQSPAEQKKTLESVTCIMCSSCTNACPSFWANRGYLGPSALLKAYRFIFDSRDRAGDERLKRITGPEGLWRCHSIYNCVEVCPKEIDITRHLSELKRLAASKKFR